MQTEQPLRDEVLVRNLRPGDLATVVKLDARNTGRSRETFLSQKLQQAFADTGIAVSLAVEMDERVVGFLLARVYYGEFGVVEPAAVLDVIGVDPDYRGRRVAAAMIDQLRTNLVGLGIRRLQTEVRWDNPELLTFFEREGFRLAQRVCLDLEL